MEAFRSAVPLQLSENLEAIISTTTSPLKKQTADLENLIWAARSLGYVLPFPYSLLPDCVQASKKRDIARAKSTCLVLFPILTVQKVSNRQSPKAFDKVGVAKIVSTA